MPLEDKRNNWQPLHAHENDTHTVVVVVREVNTCDPDDYILTVSRRRKYNRRRIKRLKA